ncbi:MAG: hypothetical protein CMJ59_13815 [Planctomycetaceae bacterium]|nr:hypothetical protein [Planctomycetaceae bacterium]
MKPILIIAAVTILSAAPSAAHEPIPDKLVVLSFDDSVKSHFTIVRPILHRYGFKATFFITEGFDFLSNKQDYMTWEEIAQLHREGFEIGNHTKDHLSLQQDNLNQLADQLQGIEQQCQKHGIPRPSSFAWPGNSIHLDALPILHNNGIRFARRGGQPERPYRSGRGFAYQPGLDHPLLIPSAGDARPNWELDDLIQAVTQARHGRVAALQFHGVPDRAHPWVSSSQERFEVFMKYLALHKYKVIAMRDLSRYIDPEVRPQNPDEIIRDRQRHIASGKQPSNARKPASDEDLRFWLTNMVAHHGFTRAEVGAATGLTSEVIDAAVKRFAVGHQASPQPDPSAPLRVLPYPGGRHPRIGFRDGAIRPQRETKVSVFTPWAEGGYVVVDVPEAIWSGKGEQRELLYLAHTHVPTRWTRQGVELSKQEWNRRPDGSFDIERHLPNRVSFGARVIPGPAAVRWELWLTNRGDQDLTGLRVQNCVLLGQAKGFEQRDKTNKLLSDPFVACHDREKKRWVITAWENCQRPWANAECPCMHSDPAFPDCPVGQTRTLHGWLSFYSGDDIQGELRRIRASDWQTVGNRKGS